MSVFDDVQQSDSSVESAVPTKQERKAKTFSEWQDVRRSLGSRYHQPRVQAQMMRDAQQLGDKFFDGRKPEDWEV
jgi:hypothetical protein